MPVCDLEQELSKESLAGEYERCIASFSTSGKYKRLSAYLIIDTQGVVHVEFEAVRKVKGSEIERKRTTKLATAWREFCKPL